MKATSAAVEGTAHVPAAHAWRPCTAQTDRSGWAAKIARFYDYWERITPPGRLPGRQHFDPLDIADLMPRVWMLDVVGVPGGNRFRYRLVGTKEVESLQREVTGLWFDEVHQQAKGWAQANERFSHMARRGVATYRKGSVLLAHHKDHQLVENCMVPLARDGQTVDMIVAYSLLYWRDGRES